MNFYSSDFLQQHAQSIMKFYDPIVVDPSGGYFHNFNDDGSLFNPCFKQLVSSCRIVVNYCRAAQVFDNQEYLTMAKHGLDYIELAHWQPQSQTFAWTLDNHKPQDLTQQAYGYAFVLLAHAHARKAGLSYDNHKIDTVFALLEQRFYQPAFGLYADEISSDGVLSDYRGQNANMHLCEALIACFEATKDNKYLLRALQIAENICQRQASLTNDLVWEHFTPEFAIDWDYNKDDPKNLYRPWGFQPGHQTEWAKLLLQLNQLLPNQWLIEKAKMLFDTAFDKSWDHQHGGLIYGFDPEGNWCDDDKYFWVQAESFAAAAMLYQATNEQKYHDCYRQIWQYSWDNFVDHQYGAWYRLLNRKNQKYSEQKSAAGAKCDYHTLGACFDVLNILAS